MLNLTAQECNARILQALQHIASGQSEPAIALLQPLEMLDVRADEVAFLLGRAYLGQERANQALAAFERAVKLSPERPDPWQGMAAAVAILGDLAKDLAFVAALKAAPIDPALRLALQERFASPPPRQQAALGGLPKSDARAIDQLIRTRSFQPALAAIQKKLQKYPGSAHLHHALGQCLRDTGKIDAALFHFDQAEKLDPEFADAPFCKGAIFRGLARYDQMLGANFEAFIRRPRSTEILCQLAIAYHAKSLADRGRHYLAIAAAQAPREPAALAALGRAHIAFSEPEAAEAALEKALKKLSVPPVNLLYALARSQEMQGKDQTALVGYEKVLARDSAHLLALTSKAGLLQQLGDFEGGRAHFRSAFKIAPRETANYRRYVLAQKVAEDDPIIAEMEALYQDPKLSDSQRVHLGFALSKALEDTRQYDRVFDYLLPANDLARKLHPYDIATHHAMIADMKGLAASLDLPNRKIAGATDYAPIFVTGLPRSGTTLVEQIIVSHSQVAGAGEIATGDRLLLSMIRQGDRMVQSLDDAAFAQFGQAYRDKLSRRFPDVAHVTDKTISTYMFLGFFKAALPNAGFIVVSRNPRDNLLSLYKNLFPENGHLYSYDFADLVKQYTSFVEIIDFWRALWPGSFYEVSYDDLVSDPEPQTRKLIEACGLPWEDACLSHHLSERKIQTLSVFQVRQPISKASLSGWKRYEKRLKPMLDLLKDAGHI